MFKKKYLVGFLGVAGAGKDTGAEVMLAEARLRGLHAHHLKFADPLKEMCAKMYGDAYHVHSKHFFGSQEDKERYFPELKGTGRDVLEGIGQAFRKFGDDVWSQVGVSKAMGLLAKDHADIVVFSDVRFRSEYDLLIANGGHIVGLTRGSLGENANRPFSDGSVKELLNIVMAEKKAHLIPNDNYTMEDYTTAVKRLTDAILTYGAL